MKRTLLCLTMSAFFAMISCSKDDDSDTTNQDLENAALEEVALDATEVSSGIIIEGAEKKQGQAPAPNGNATFIIDTKKQSAFQQNGFDIELQVPENYAGSYLVIQDANGMAAEYFDIPKGAGLKNKNVAKPKTKKNFLKSSVQKMNENEVEIDVDFKNIPPGQFCYLLCIYTEEGFVSQPSEICVEVEAWGGNSTVVGEWSFQKSTYVYDDINDTTEVGVIECDDRTIYCVNQDQVNVEDAYCDTTLFGNLKFNNDGTYTYISETDVKTIDYEKSEEACEAVFREFVEEVISNGNWAYNEEENILTIVEFEYTDEEGTETYEDGDLSFSGTLKVDGSTMEIYEEEIYEGQLETYLSIFKRK